MKKTISLILAFVLCLSLCACSAGGGDDGFDAQYASMIERVEKLNADTSKITGIVYGTWSNIGVSDFYTFFGGLRSLTEGTTLDGIKYTFLGAAACCLFPSEYWDDDTEMAWNLRNAVEKLQADAEKAQHVLDAAIEYNNLYDSLKDSDDSLSSDMKVFKDKFKDKHAEEVETLSDWVLESSMYVDLALEPSGSLVEYGNNISTYEEKLNRFSKIANAY